MRKPFVVTVDTHGSCNLHCPSCPTGRREPANAAIGMVTPEFVGQICQKALRESRVVAVALQSWTEPTLHPRLPDLIRTVHDHGIPVWLSTNANYKADWKAIMGEKPDNVTISCSGYTQTVYSVTHKGGQVERVKDNMAAIMRAQLPPTRVKMAWHRYSHNLHEEPLMKLFCETWGIGFNPVDARYLPLERVLPILEDKPAEYDSLMNLLLTPFHEIRRLCQKHKNVPCRSQEGEITMDSAGNVAVCCSLYDMSKYRIGNFLTDSLETLQQRKRESSICDRCMAVGAHAYMTNCLSLRRRAYTWAVHYWHNTIGQVVTPPKRLVNFIKR